MGDFPKPENNKPDDRKHKIIQFTKDTYGKYKISDPNYMHASAKFDLRYHVFVLYALGNEDDIKITEELLKYLGLMEKTDSLQNLIFNRNLSKEKMKEIQDAIIQFWGLYLYYGKKVYFEMWFSCQ